MQQRRGGFAQPRLIGRDVGEDAVLDLVPQRCVVRLGAQVLDDLKFERRAAAYISGDVFRSSISLRVESANCMRRGC